MNIEVLKYTGRYFLVKLDDPLFIGIIRPEIYNSLKVWVSKALIDCAKKESGSENAVWNVSSDTYLIFDSILSRNDNGYRLISNPNVFNNNTFDSYIIGSVDLKKLNDETFGIFTVCKTTKSPEGRGMDIINSIVSYLRNYTSSNIKKFWLGVLINNKYRNIVTSIYIRAGFKTNKITKTIPGSGIHDEFFIEMELDRESDYIIDDYEINEELKKCNNMLKFGDDIISKMTPEQYKNVIDIDYIKEMNIEEYNTDLFVIVDVLELYNKIYGDIEDSDDIDRNELFKSFKDNLSTIRKENYISELCDNEDNYDIIEQNTLIVLQVKPNENWDDVKEDYSSFICCLFDLNLNDNKINLYNFSITDLSLMKDIINGIFNYIESNQHFVNYNLVSIILPLRDSFIREICIRSYVVYGFDNPFINYNKYFSVETDRSLYLTSVLTEREKDRNANILNFKCKKTIESYEKTLDEKLDYKTDIIFSKSTLERLKTLITSSSKTYGLNSFSTADSTRYEYSGGFEIENATISEGNLNDTIELKLKNILPYIEQTMNNTERLKYLPSVIIGEKQDEAITFFSSFAFHTHPVKTMIEYKVSIAPPSGGDLDVNIHSLKYFKNVSNFVVTLEGIYCIYFDVYKYDNYISNMSKLRGEIERELKRDIETKYPKIDKNERKQKLINKMKDKYSATGIIKDYFEYPYSLRKHVTITDTTTDEDLNNYYRNEVRKYFNWLSSDRFIKIGTKEFSFNFIRELVSIQFLSWKELKNKSRFSISFGIDKQYLTH